MELEIVYQVSLRWFQNNNAQLHRILNDLYYSKIFSDFVSFVDQES